MINHRVNPSLEADYLQHPEFNDQYFSGNIDSSSAKIYFKGDVDQLGLKKYTDLILEAGSLREPDHFNHEFFITDLNAYCFKIDFIETTHGLEVHLSRKHFWFYISAMDLLYDRFLLVKPGRIRSEYTIMSLLIPLTLLLFVNIFYFKTFAIWHLLLYILYIEITYSVIKDHILIIRQRKFMDELFIAILEKIT